uniref:Uncharacterized protein n=1 Tax=Glossina pallidipes TaxID=7398 RepID=A0A1A9ZAL3_GLOPL
MIANARFDMLFPDPYVHCLVLLSRPVAYNKESLRHSLTEYFQTRRPSSLILLLLDFSALNSSTQDKIPVQLSKSAVIDLLQLLRYALRKTNPCKRAILSVVNCKTK